MSERVDRVLVTIVTCVPLMTGFGCNEIRGGLGSKIDLEVLSLGFSFVVILCTGLEVERGLPGKRFGLVIEYPVIVLFQPFVIDAETIGRGGYCGEIVGKT